MAGFIRVTRLERSIQHGDAPVIYIQKDKILYMYVNKDGETALVTDKFAVYVEEKPYQIAVLVLDASMVRTEIHGDVCTMETDDMGDRIDRQRISIDGEVLADVFTSGHGYLSVRNN